MEQVRPRRSKSLLESSLWLGRALALFASISSYSIAGGQEPSLIAEYRAACDRVESVMNSDQYEAASQSERSELLHENLFNDIQSEEVRESFEVISAAAPEDRYEVLRESIQEETGQSWECSGLAQIMSSDP